MKRPSFYMLPCAIAVLVTFSVSGHLRVDLPAEPQRIDQAKTLTEPTAGSSAGSSGGALADSVQEPEAGKPVVVREPLRVKAASKPARIVTQTLVGTVLDAMGSLLVGAEVAHGETRARTDAEGRFAIEVPQDDTADLHVSSNGYRSMFWRAMPMSPRTAVRRARAVRALG